MFDLNSISSNFVDFFAVWILISQKMKEIMSIGDIQSYIENDYHIGHIGLM